MVFDPTLVRGMGYYTGTIFEIAMPEFGGSCGGGGRYDKMVGRFTGNDVPACGFSIGFERIILLLLESGFKIPGQAAKKAYLIEKGYPADKLQEVIAQAQKERSEGTQVLVVRMNKNKKFQKEKLTAEGYEEFVEFLTDSLFSARSRKWNDFDKIFRRIRKCQNPCRDYTEPIDVQKYPMPILEKKLPSWDGYRKEEI